ncbi:hypothetical protein SDC9_200910 [bioreactor metagenome]|uniref:Uncharacterized protein n=1 Tax=bioreactor metagenome TaxID=1076179 RepID=A0A645IQ78_9ZZZZ
MSDPPLKGEAHHMNISKVFLPHYNVFGTIDIEAYAITPYTRTQSSKESMFTSSDVSL